MVNIKNCFIFALAFKERSSLSKNETGGLPEWLTEQFAKLSTRKGRVGSNPTPSATTQLYSGRSVVRSSRLVWDQEVAGSNPAAPTSFSNFLKITNGCVAQLDRASAF